MNYECRPHVIESKSFEIIRAQVDLNGLCPLAQQVAYRLIHTTGNLDIIQSLRFSADACTKAVAAISNTKPVLCDVNMVRVGLTQRLLKQTPLCFLSENKVINKARSRNETRSMVAVDCWDEYLEGSLVLIGNAPTALFRLLEKLEQGAPKPALVIGMPVGFVGAAESKLALWEMHKSLGIDAICLLGHLGGSAVTAAAFNALLRCEAGEFY